MIMYLFDIIAMMYFKLSNAMNFNILNFFVKQVSNVFLMYCIDPSSFPLNIYINEISTIYFSRMT